MLVDYTNPADLTPTKLSTLLDKIGWTPIQHIGLLIQGRVRKISLKMENFNPTGSMKDRTGLALIQYVEKQGRLRQDSTIIESSSGNLGVALAFQCKARGYPFVAVIDPKTTQEVICKMKILDARIELVPEKDVTGGYLLSRLARVHELCSLNDRYVWTDQYSSPANPLMHYDSTGPEIYHQMNGQVDVIFVPVSTGGTLAGIGRFFQETSPSTQVIGVDAYGSVIFENKPAARILTGIGSSRKSTFLDKHLYDTYMLIHDEEAFAFCRALHASTQLKLGGSSGATLAACAHYLYSHPFIKNAVCVCADTGENYTSSIFNDEWIQQKHLDVSQNKLDFVEKIMLI